MQDSSSWATAVGAVLSAIFAFFKWLLPFLKEWERTRRDIRTVQGFALYQKLYLALEGIRDAGVQRVIVFSGHNGGGIPRPGSPFFVSALHWSIEARDRTTPNKYQNLPIDTGYISMLVDVMDRGELRFHPDDMPCCQLKDIYLSEGVEDSFVIYLGTKDKQLYYLSAATFHGAMTASQLTEIRLQANVIRNILTSQ